MNSQSIDHTRLASYGAGFKYRPRKRSDAAMDMPTDRGEPTSLMEPLLLGESSRWRPAIHDKALTLVAASTRLDTSLPRGVAHGLAQLVRSVNC